MINGICENKEKIPVKHSYSIVGDCKSRIFWKPYSPGVFMWQLTTKMPLEQAQELAKKEPSEWKKVANETMKDWNHKVMKMVYTTEETKMRCSPLFDRDPLTIEKMKGLGNMTFVGDACHPMAPFKGQGANQALEDIVCLAKMLKDPISKSLREFETLMIKRASKPQTKSRELVLKIHSEDVAEILKDAA